MSESDSTNTWSGSVDSYFSESSSSSSWHCPAPRRLVSLMAEQLRRMKCRKNGDEQDVEMATCMINQDQNVHPQQLAGLLRERLERLNAENDEDEQPVRRSPRRVSFLDDEIPSCSGVAPAPNLLAEEIMDVDVTFRSEAPLPVPSTSADATVIEGLQKDDLGKIILDGQTSIFYLNFPELNKLDDSVTTADVHVSEGTARPEEGAAAGKSAKDKTKIIHTTNGEVRVYENGRVTISFGGNVYQMTNSTIPAVEQEVVRVDQVEGVQSGVMTSLGTVRHYIDVLPLMVDEDNMDEIRTDKDEEKSKSEDGHDE